MKHKFRTLTTLAILTTATIHFLNRTTNFKYQNSNYLYEDDAFYYEYRFGKVRYTKKGNGNPVLLIHSLDTGSSYYEFNKLSQELVKTNLVYSIDLPGYGLSDKPKITYTNYFYVQLIDSFIKNVIKEKTTIITSGNSSSIALMECVSNSDVVDKLIFINPQYIYDMNLIPSRRNKILQSIFELPVYGTFFYKLYNHKNNFREKFVKEYFYDPAKIKDQDIEAYLESALHEIAGSKYSYSSYHNNYMNINFLSALKNCKNPIILLGGSDEKDIQTNLESYKHYNNSIEIHYIPNTKKLPHLENPNGVLAKLKDI